MSRQYSVMEYREFSRFPLHLVTIGSLASTPLTPSTSAWLYLDSLLPFFYFGSNMKQDFSPSFGWSVKTDLAFLKEFPPFQKPNMLLCMMRSHFYICAYKLVAHPPGSFLILLHCSPFVCKLTSSYLPLIAHHSCPLGHGALFCPLAVGRLLPLCFVCLGSLVYWTSPRP